MKLITSHQYLAREIPYGRVAWLTTVSILSVVYYLACLTLLQALGPRVDPLPGGASLISADAYAHWTNVAFIVLGLGGMALTTGLYVAVPTETRPSAGLALLGMWAAALALAEIFISETVGAPQTTAVAIQHLFGKNILCMAAVAAFMARDLKLRRRWQGLARMASARK